MNSINWDKWKDIKNIIIFGYGRQASKIIEKLEESFHIVAVVDNDKKKRWAKNK